MIFSGSASVKSFLVAVSITCLSPQSVHAIEINGLHYCSVTVAQGNGEDFTILVPKINLPKIQQQLDVRKIDCSSSAPNPLF